MASSSQELVEWPEMAARLPSPAPFRMQTRNRVWLGDNPPHGAGKGDEGSDFPPGHRRAGCAERNLVERFFNIIKHFRAIATRYEKTARNFLAGLHLVCALAWLK
jgi:transposase